MGTHAYKFLVVVGERQPVLNLHGLTVAYNEQQKRDSEPPVPVSPVYTVGNDTLTFTILPSGSKVGWEYHQACEALIEQVEEQAAVLRAGIGGPEEERPFLTTFRGVWGEVDPRWQIDGDGDMP